MALNTQKWLSIFQEELFPDNTFYSGAVNDTPQVIGAEKVLIPNYQEESTIWDMKTGTVISGPIAGPIAFPASPNQLAHTSKEYNLSQYAFVPYIVNPVELEEFSYDKIVAVMNQSINALNTVVANKILWDWTVVSTGSIVSSTGTSTRLNRFGNTVKRITYADISKMSTMLNLQNVPRAGRRLIVDSNGEDDIRNMPELQGSPALVQQAFTNGAIMNVMGFDVFSRSETTGFTLANAKKVLGAVDALTDLSSAIAYHPSMVRYAHGTSTNGATKIIFIENAPGAYGSQVEGYSRVGASTSYAENANVTKGVVTLIESV